MGFGARLLSPPRSSWSFLKETISLVSLSAISTASIMRSPDDTLKTLFFTAASLWGFSLSSSSASRPSSPSLWACISASAVFSSLLDPSTLSNISSSSLSRSSSRKTISLVRSHTLTCRSIPALRTKDPLPLTARQFTSEAWPLRRRIWLNLSPSQKRTVRSFEQVKKLRVRLTKRKSVMESSWPYIVRWVSPKSRPQILMDLSAPPEANMESSELESNARTGSLCPYRLRKNLRESSKKTLIVESRAATNSRRFSGSVEWENLTHMTSSDICNVRVCSTVG
mmetsp:Transcript_30522/g.73679  ORF Transcript_30522/g.73679 Transcript_30522/m.73679 type:complete len:282 (-) Transcript_30522:728-1573(-)